MQQANKHSGANQEAVARCSLYLHVKHERGRKKNARNGDAVEWTNSFISFALAAKEKNFAQSEKHCLRCPKFSNSSSDWILVSRRRVTWWAQINSSIHTPPPGWLVGKFVSNANDKNARGCKRLFSWVVCRKGIVFSMQIALRFQRLCRNGQNGMELPWIYEAISQMSSEILLLHQNLRFDTK